MWAAKKVGKRKCSLFVKRKEDEAMLIIRTILLVVILFL